MKAFIPSRRRIIAYLLWLPLLVTGQFSMAHSIASNKVVYNVPQESIVVTGTRTATDGESLPGVNILIKGTSTGTVTDVEGKFSIAVPSRESVLIISSIGYETEELTVGDKTAFDINLA